MYRKIFCIAFFICLFVAVVFVVPIHCAQGYFATVFYVEGLVFVKSPGEKWVPALKNMSLQEEDIIKTAQDSYCDISLGESLKNIISLSPETEVTVGRYFQGIMISEGRVFSLIEGLEPGSSFEVRTPVASGGARGTAWETVAYLATKFNVLKDTVYVKGFNDSGDVSGEINVTQGKSIEVDEKGKLGEVSELTGEEIKRLEVWLKKITDNIDQSSSGGNWKEVIDGYEGESPDLFTEVLQLEVEQEQGAIKDSEKDEEIIFPGNDDSSPGITGGDLTTGTFATDAPSSPGRGSGSGQ